MPSPRTAEIDEMLTIEPPPRSTMTGTACFEARKAVRRLMSRARSQSSSLVSTTVPTNGPADVVHEDVEAAERVDRGPHHRLAVGRPGAVGRRTPRRCRPRTRSAPWSPRPARAPGRRTAPRRPRGASTRPTPCRCRRPGPGVDPAPVTMATLPSTRPARSAICTLPLRPRRTGSVSTSSAGRRRPRSRPRSSRPPPRRPPPGGRRPRPAAGARPRRCARRRRAAGRPTAGRPRC